MRTPPKHAAVISVLGQIEARRDWHEAARSPLPPPGLVGEDIRRGCCSTGSVGALARGAGGLRDAAQVSKPLEERLRGPEMSV